MCNTALPIITVGFLFSFLLLVRISAAAIPICIARSFVKSLFAIPLTPSVPNNLPKKNKTFLKL